MSGLWTFRRKNPEQTLDSVLSAIPTAAVQVVAASTTLDLDLLQNNNNNYNFTSSSSASPEIKTANQLKSALEETESNENAIDPEWATLRNKWLNEEFHAAQLSSGLQQQQQKNTTTIFSQVDDEDEDEFSREYREYENRLKKEDVAAKQWLYQVSPEKKSPSASPNPNPTSSTMNNNKPQEEILYYHGLENRRQSRSVSSSYDDRRGKSSSYSPAHQIEGDIVDYRSLLARVERQVMATEIGGKEQSPIPPAKERQFILQTNSHSSSYITAAPANVIHDQSLLRRRSLNNSNPQEQQHRHINRSVTKTASAAALFRANQSLARTDANLDQIVRSQHEIEQKKENVVRVASLMEMKKTSTSSSIMKVRPSSAASRGDNNNVASAPVRSVVSTKLNFPTTTTINTSSSNRESTTNEISSKKVSVDETLKRSQQISRSASSALKTVHEQQKPSARAALHKTVSSKFADPNSNEFKMKLNRDLEIMEEEEKKKKMMMMMPPPPSTTRATTVVQSKTTISRSSSKAATVPTPVAISDPFVQRMMQRTKERDEARKNLLQKYQDEKEAKIQREIQEAEQDAQRTLAERTKAAKLREKMQKKMREDQERKEQLVHLDDAREQMGEALCRRHYLGRVGFYPWRRFVQEKQRIADLLHDHQLTRASFARLKRNVVFERKLRQTVLVTRCVGLTRLLKRWTMRFVLMKLRRNVLDSKCDVRDAKKQHLRNCLRRWKRKALKHQAVSMVRKDQWCEEQCVEAETFREKLQLRKTFRKWNIKLQKKKDDEERQKIRSKMWSIAMSALTD